MGVGAAISLVIGPPNAGKLGFLLDWWGALASRRPLLVVPTRRDVSDLTLELLERQGALLGAAAVGTFDELVQVVRGESVPAMTSLQRLLTIRGLLRDRALQRLDAISDLPGAVPAVAALLHELDQSGPSPADVLASLQAWAAAGGEPSALADDVCRLYAGYRAACERGDGGDGADGLHAAIEHLAMSAAGTWQRPVACYGFATFSPLQRRLLQCLALSAPVALSLPSESRRPLGEVVAVEVEAWRAAGAHIVELPAQPQAYSSPGLAYLERHFFVEGSEIARTADGPCTTEGPLSGVRFLLSSGQRAEVESVAREIVGLLGQGVAPDDIGVVVRGLGARARRLVQVFRAFDIPCRLDTASALGATGLGHALMAALRGVARADAAAMLTFLRSAYGSAPSATVDGLHAELLAAGGVGADGLLSRVEDVLPGSLTDARGALRWDGSRPVGLDPAGVVTLAERMLVAAAAGESLTGDEVREDARVLSTVQRALGGPGRAGPRAALAAADLDAACAALDALDVPGDEVERRGVVEISTVHRARARRKQVVFVLGLVEGEFPRNTRPPALLGVAGRRALNRAAGRPVLPEEPTEEEAALFSVAISRAWQLVYLSARDCEDDGSVAVPSVFWTDARRVLGVSEPPVSRDLGQVVERVADAVTLRGYLRACAHEGLVPGDATLANRLEATRRQPVPGRLRNPHVIEALASRDVFSASELEAYAMCPFAWFARYLVGLESIEPEAGPPIWGRLAHQVLARTYAALGEAGRLPLDDAGLESARGLAAASLERAVEAVGGIVQVPDGPLGLWKIVQKIDRFLEWDAASGSTLTPTLLEYDFGRPDGVDLGGLALKGRIDRVDTGPGGTPALVVDYKLGAAVYGPAFTEQGALQVPLYMMVLRTLHPEVRLAGGVYAALGAQAIGGMVREEDAAAIGGWATRSSVCADDRFDAELGAALDACRTAAGGIRDGAIAAEPVEQCPRFCDLGPLCRSRRRGGTG